MNMNSVIAEVTRGGILESQHRGAYAVSDSSGKIVAQDGDIFCPVFPRSAIKAFQCLPVIESGAAEQFGFSDEEIALCCASHGGEPEHVRVARSILAKAGLTESAYECGVHWPNDRNAAYALVRQNQDALAIHNNCSGKHAGMLALSKHLGAATADYVRPDHIVQRTIARTIEHMCDVDLSHAAVGIDGCSVPTWAMPLANMALGFARLCDENNRAARRILTSVRAHPFMVAGTGRFDTKVMQAIPRLFLKTGAEGVYCGCISHAGLGFALKCDDGATRGAEVATVSLMLKLDVWTTEERSLLTSFTHQTLTNWRKIEVGEVYANP